MVRIDPEKLPPDTTQARLGCGQDVKQGSAVVAYGHPINLTFTATTRHRLVCQDAGLPEFVQMDASINPGNSGGPLLGVDAGAVIGVNNGEFPRRVGPRPRHLDPARLPDHGDPGAGRGPDRADAADLLAEAGRNETLTVAAPSPTPPTRAQAGDVVTGIAGGRTVAGLPDLITALRGRRESVTLTVRRDGATMEVKAPAHRRHAGAGAAGRLIRRAFGGGTPVARPGGDRAAAAPNRVHPARRDGGPRRLPAVGSSGNGGRPALCNRRRALHDWLKAQPANAKVPVLIRRHIAAFDRRHRRGIPPLRGAPDRAQADDGRRLRVGAGTPRVPLVSLPLAFGRAFAPRYGERGL